MMRLIALFALLLLTFPTHAQKVLQIEKYGRYKTKKIHIGEAINYKLYDDDVWYTGYIENIEVEKNLLVMKDRYVDVSKIEKMRRPLRWSKPMRSALYLFGASWSANAFIGTLTDGNKDTNYRWSDAIVTGVSWITGWIIPKIFKYRTWKFGKKRRLRVLDLSPVPGGKIKA
ncbi:MAG: hypothetical protein SFU99_20075 [Saprospiraceae bacterium]|nr:hypothetical protein [Saprospiraceae bacterium]